MGLLHLIAINDNDIIQIIFKKISALIQVPHSFRNFIFSYFSQNQVILLNFVQLFEEKKIKNEEKMSFSINRFCKNHNHTIYNIFEIPVFKF